MVPTGAGSSSGAEVAPENGLPMKIITAMASPSPAAPMRAIRPAAVAPMASTVSDSAAQVATASCGSAPRKPWAIR